MAISQHAYTTPHVGINRHITGLVGWLGGLTIDERARFLWPDVEWKVQNCRMAIMRISQKRSWRLLCAGDGIAYGRV
jgi:hypothetical protein